MDINIFESLRPIVDRAATLLGMGRGADGSPSPSPSPLPLPLASSLSSPLSSPLSSSLSSSLSSGERMLAARFGLDRLDLDLLRGLLAAECAPMVRLLVRSVQGGGHAWLELGTLVELLGLPATDVGAVIGRLSVEGALLRRGLVEAAEKDVAPAVSKRYKLVDGVMRFLLGELGVGQGLQLRAASHIDHARSPSLAGVAVDDLAAAIHAHRGALCVEIAGPDRCGRRRVAAGLAAALAQPLLVADLGDLSGTALATRLREAEREATLRDALLCLHLPSPRLPVAVSTPGEEPSSNRPRLRPELAEVLARLDRPCVLVVDATEPLFETLGLAVVRATVRFPNARERETLLRIELADRQLSVEGAERTVEHLARTMPLDPPGVARAVARAALMARGRQSTTLTVDELRDACQRQLRSELTGVATPVPLMHEWSDLVVSEEVYHTLCEMVSYLEHQSQVYEEWGFGRGRANQQGVSALFAGPPGTGKTMCASVIARELGMELVRVDLSQVVSKWIGETERNLGRLFDEAERSNAVILFDEADSLFAKRSDVKSSNDRYANLEVNFLLQRMETYPGVVILTTNHEHTIDSAFKRRLTFRCHFEKPDLEARTALWQKAIPRSCALAADVELGVLAASFDMSGAHIKNAVLRAAFLAAAAGTPVDMATLTTATERECRELGLLVRDRELRTDQESVPEPAPKPTLVLPIGTRRPLVPPRLVPISHRRTRVS